MDIDQIRLKNLEALLTQYEEKCRQEGRTFFYKDFARDHGMGEKNLQHIRKGTRAMGKNVARRIERAKKFPKGWMDVEHRESLEPLTPTQQALVYTFSEIVRTKEDKAAEIIMQLLRNNTKKK
jgi:hypothetical protein